MRPITASGTGVISRYSEFIDPYLPTARQIAVHNYRHFCLYRYGSGCSSFREEEYLKWRHRFLSRSMNTLSPFLSIHSSCDEALQLAKKQLSQAGLRPVQTFDLQTARLGPHDCSCPHHGTDECDCQMIVLLVYGEMAEPATLILHGNDGQTWVSVSDIPSQQTDKKLMASIRQAFKSLSSAGAKSEPGK